MRFGQNLWICPHDQEVEAANAVVVKLDPGLAFGTGTHPTTALCLDWIAEHVKPGKSVIDFGCGSGILAIAAAKLGAQPIWALDHDPQALQATRTNAEQNHVNSQIITGFSEDFTSIKADIVIANILANPLIELANQLLDRLQSQGQLILSGILQEQAENVIQAYAKKINFAKPISKEDWVLLIGKANW